MLIKNISYSIHAFFLNIKQSQDIYAKQFMFLV